MPGRPARSGPGAVVGVDDVDATVVPVLDDDGPHPLRTAIDTTTTSTTSVVEARTRRPTVRIGTSSGAPGRGRYRLGTSSTLMVAAYPGRAPQAAGEGARRPRRGPPALDVCFGPPPPLRHGRNRRGVQGPDAAARHHDRDDAGAGVVERRGCASGPRPGDPRVVEEKDAPPPRSVTHLECVGTRGEVMSGAPTRPHVDASPAPTDTARIGPRRPAGARRRGRRPGRWHQGCGRPRGRWPRCPTSTPPPR